MDGTEKQQDETTSAESTGTSEQAESYTKEQVQERERKARSDALAEVGRYKKSAEDAIKAAQAAEERLNRMLKEQDEVALESARDDPDRMKQIRARQKERERATELDKREAELKAKEEEVEAERSKVADVAKERNARELAQQFDVSMDTLMTFTDGSREKMEELAKQFPKKNPAPKIKPDSGVTAGGGTKYTTSQIKQMDKSAFAAFQKETGGRSVLQLIKDGVVVDK